MNTQNPKVLASCRNEFEAGVLVNLLAERGIRARATGEYTAGFRAEAPGDVHVLVRPEDLDQARAILDQSHTSGDDGSAEEP